MVLAVIYSARRADGSRYVLIGGPGGNWGLCFVLQSCGYGPAGTSFFKGAACLPVPLDDDVSRGGCYCLASTWKLDSGPTF